MSMLDDSVLKSLPPEIRNEIIASYNEPSTSSSASLGTSVLTPSTDTSSSKSSFTKILTKKSKKASPVKAKSRSKPKVKAKPKAKSDSVIGPLDHLLKTKKMTAHDLDIMNVYHSRASICGQKDLDSVIKLIKEWIETEEGKFD